MEEWYPGMDFDGKQTIGRSEITSFGYAHQFFEKLELVIIPTDMLYDGIGIRDGESVFGKGEGTAISRNALDCRVALGEGAHIALTQSGDVMRMGIVFFEIVVAFGILLRIDTDIDDSFVWLWCGQTEKLREFFRTTSL